MSGGVFGLGVETCPGDLWVVVCGDVVVVWFDLSGLWFGHKQKSKIYRFLLLNFWGGGQKAKNPINTKTKTRSTRSNVQ